jgi:hypothetical protein
MKSVGIPGVLGMTAGAMLAATWIPLTVAAPARAGCLPGDFDFCDPGATVTTTSLLFDPSGMDTSISNPADDFSADIFNNGAGTVNEFFVNSDPELGLGVSQRYRRHLHKSLGRLNLRNSRRFHAVRNGLNWTSALS